LCHLMISITSDILRFGCSAIHERCIINIYIQLMKNRHFRNLYKCDIMESLSMMSCDKIYGSMSQLHVRSDRQPLRMFEVSRIPNSLQKNLKPIQGLLCYHFPLIVHRHIHLDEFMAIVASLNYHRFRFRCIRDENVRRIVSILSSSVQFTRDKIVDYDMYRSIISSILRLIRPRTTIENLEVFSVQMKCHLCTNLYTFLVDLELYVTLISLIMKYIIRINTLDMMKFVAVTMGHLMDLCVTIPYYHPLEVHDQLILIIRMFGYYINVLCSLCNCSKHVRKSCGRDLHLRNNSENQATDVAVSVLVSRGLLHLIQLLEVCPIYHKDPFRRSAHFCYTICGKVDKILSTFGDFFEVLHIPTIVSVFRKMLRPIFGALVAKPSCKKLPSRVKPVFIRFSRTFSRLIKSYGVSKYLNALSPLYIELMTDFTDFSQSRNLLLNGLFAVFDQLKLRDFRRLHLSMNSSSRILLAELKELHFNDFKYFGKL